MTQGLVEAKPPSSSTSSLLPFSPQATCEPPTGPGKELSQGTASRPPHPTSSSTLSPCHRTFTVSRGPHFPAVPLPLPGAVTTGPNICAFVFVARKRPRRRSMTSGHVLHSGWLRKSPPEEKLRLFAWRKRWFILRRGQTSSDPDVLEYYKNDGSKNPLRTINLNLCEQLDVGVTLNFNKKEIQKGYMFDIKTSERTFYLVAETREDMNEWVQSICQICGFRQVEESTGSLGNISSASHGPCSSAAEPSRSHQHLPQEREPASEPPVSHHVPPIWPILAPRGCLCSHQHASQKAGHARSASFSQGSRAPFPLRRSTAMQNLAQHCQYSVDGVSGHIHGFHSLSKPSQHNTEFRGGTCRTPWSLASHGHTRGSLTGSEADNEGVYPFKAPRSTLCQEFGDHLVNNNGVPAIPLSAHQIPRTVTLDKNLCATAMATPGPIGSLPLPKASQAEAFRGQESGNILAMWVSTTASQCGDHALKASAPGDDLTYPVTATWSTHLSGHYGERTTNTEKVHPSYFRSASFSQGSRAPFPMRRSTAVQNLAQHCQYSPGKALVGLSDSIASEDSCVPMNPGFPTLVAVEQAGSDSQGVCTTVGSCPVCFNLLGFPLTELSVHQDVSQGREVQLPPVNRSLKPNRKANPTPSNLRNNRVISELSFKPPVTESWSGTSHTFYSSSSQYPISMQSITSTDSEDSGERDIFLNAASAFPVSGGTSSSALPRSTGTIHYVALDFQPSKSSIGSVTSGEKVDYVQVDLEKTWALQKTMHEQMCLRQSLEPPRGAKL
ncbi:PREDICTED: GRB2-associated-binding protein 4 [Cercocebus atys]|uniref:GRB2-associated-binding protein 4 n=1 Tax=Cercocebus atys TaxID=9531 RepID=UPI0005F3D2E1|nr:PREDICTED: GRB2-associated-binding protein 4 [Cercocebus atys]